MNNLETIDAQVDHHERHARRLQLKTIPLIFISILLGPLGNVLLGKGMKTVGHVELRGVGDLIPAALQVFASPILWLGIACLIGFFLVHMLLLTWADYSYVQPATALSYATVAVLSYFLLGEYVSPLRWAGIGLICVGVLVVGRTPPNTTVTR